MYKLFVILLLALSASAHMCNEEPPLEGKTMPTKGKTDMPVKNPPKIPGKENVEKDIKDGKTKVDSPAKGIMDPVEYSLRPFSLRDVRVEKKTKASPGKEDPILPKSPKYDNDTKVGKEKGSIDEN
jgi:hypothetical protein